MRAKRRDLAVIMPFYNQSRFFKEALSSLRDNVCNPQIYVINDGSDADELDKIVHVCEESADITLLTQENRGLSSARNLGLSHSDEPYVLFLDGDDVVGTGQLDMQLHSLRSGGYDICLTKWAALSYQLNALFPKNTYNGEMLDALFVAENWESYLSIPIHTAMFNRDSIGDIRFNETLKSKEDLFFWINYFKEQKKTSFIDKYCAGYRMGGFSMSRGDKNLNRRSFAQVIKLCKENEFSDEIVRELTINYRRLYGTWD